MKPLRVTITSIVVAVFVLFVFLVPLPVSRVIQTGAIELQPDPDQPDDSGKVFVPFKAILKSLGPRTSDGQEVQEGEELAVLYSPEMEQDLEDAQSQVKQRQNAINSGTRQMNERLDPEERNMVQTSLATARGELAAYRSQSEILQKSLNQLILRAPRSGVIMSPPHPDEVGKQWEKEQNIPFCTIGDPGKLRVVVPVSPSEYRLLKRDREKLLKDGKDLEVTFRVHGRETNTWKGKIVRLPESAAKYIPASLSNKCGGPVATKPSARPDIFEPVSQQYLVYVELQNPDAAIRPGLIAQAKIHCKYRTLAWWAWHSISEAFNLGYDLDPFHQSD
jgi:putative peptide zinc metalloprotease protein